MCNEQSRDFAYGYFLASVKCNFYIKMTSICSRPCRVGSVGSVSASRTVGREFASWPGHTKDNHKNGTNCLPAWHAMR